MKKTIIIFTVLLLGLMATGFSQSKKIQKKVIKKIESLDESIVKVNKEAALTDKQKETLKVIYAEQFVKIEKIKNEVIDTEKRKAQIKQINRKYIKIINKEVLTNEQKKAKKNSKNK
ncbi:hypothetical protein UMM65_16195 [Aureibaculum sp. 2210JD6-5]|uniref:hypothetical protein n=1 Tax=Aureibaculum sp. 2210JD6-5 TaxID=3103957 RepID=UPI002AACAA97|nr:hypothetical protein [Aureibaculum sp. 2210JD6-5]MDY7396790.1 hypothetical protein [Aureibaculum sp. 2210JD6-5]